MPEAQDTEAPLGKFTFRGQDYPYWGSLHGHNRTVTDTDMGKFNRYAKLGHVADEVEDRLKELAKGDDVDARCAYACLIMMLYGVRVGNEDSAEGYTSELKENAGTFVQTYGTTTLLNKHVTFEGNKVVLDFLGKKQVGQHVELSDKFVVDQAKRWHRPDRPDDKWLGVDYDTLFRFVKRHVGNFIPKDFRTFCANITAWRTIKRLLKKKKQDKKSVKEEVKRVVEDVSDRLGNTPGIAKKSYVDHRLLDWFMSKRTVKTASSGELAFASADEALSYLANLTHRTVFVRV